MKDIIIENFLAEKKVSYESGDFRITSNHDNRNDFIITKIKGQTWHSINSTLAHILKVYPPNDGYKITTKHF